MAVSSSLLISCAIALTDKIVLGEVVVPVLLTEARTWILQLVIDSKAECVGIDEIKVGVLNFQISTESTTLATA